MHCSNCEGFTSGTQIAEDIYRNMKELNQAWHIEWDDKWDVEDRNKIDYFYLDLSTGLYYALPKYKDGYDSDLGFDMPAITIMSKKIFRR